MFIKVMIADDDPGMRLVLKKIIGNLDGFELIGEAEDGESAISLAASIHPNVIFMDVEMPVLDGVESAKRIMDINPKTIFIFATAHEAYMQDAFKLYAFDYLVKPFKVDRVRQTLERIKEMHIELQQQPIKEFIQHEKGLAKLMIRNKEGISFIDMDDIILVQREDRSTVIYTSDDRYTTS